MGVKVTGNKATSVNIRNAAVRSSAGGRAALRRGATKIKDRARKYAPRLHIDDPSNEPGLGVLETAINFDESADKQAHRRIMIDVGVDEDRAAPGNKTVGDYATVMHESDYDLGPESEAKGGRSAGVGSKYLERAYLELEDEVRADVEANALKGIGK